MRCPDVPPHVPAGTLRGRNLVLLLTLGVIWGTAFMFISLGLPSFSPVYFAALRFDIAGVALLGIALARKARLRLTTRAQWAAVVIAAFFNVCLYHAFLFWGQRFTTASIAAVLVGLNPLLTTVATRAFLREERVGAAGVAGLLMGVGGIAVLAGLRPGDLLDAQGVGELAVVAAVASWALGSTLVKRTRHGMDVFAFTAWHMLLGAVFLHIGALLVDEGGGWAVWDRDGLVSLLYLALASSGLGFLLYFTILERVGPIRSNMVSHVAPVFATIAGFLVLGEPFEARSVVAFVLIAGGFLLVARE